jgi:hypothetical protein
MFIPETCRWIPSHFCIHGFWAGRVVQVEHLGDPLNDVLSDEKACDVSCGISSSGIEN